MADGADYPGYPEPEPEEEQDSMIRAIVFPLWNAYLHFVEIFADAGKMVIGAFIGAFMGVELSAELLGETQIQGLMPFYIAFTFVYMVCYAMKKVIESGVLYR